MEGLGEQQCTWCLNCWYFFFKASLLIDGFVRQVVLDIPAAFLPPDASRVGFVILILGKYGELFGSTAYLTDSGSCPSKSVDP